MERLWCFSALSCTVCAVILDRVFGSRYLTFRSAAQVTSCVWLQTPQAMVQPWLVAQGGTCTLAEVRVWCVLLYEKRSSKCFASSVLNSCSSVSEIVILGICRGGGGPLQLEALVPAASPWSKFLVAPGELFQQAWCILLVTLCQRGTWW